MKTKAICSFFVLFAMVAGLVAAAPAAYADHSEVIINNREGSGVPGCEETEEGCYIPNIATVDVGGKVIMENTDTAAHTYTSGTPEDKDGQGEIFNSGLVASGGAAYEWSPTEVGEYPYFCMVHPWMTGMIIVQEKADEGDHGHDDGDMMMSEDDASATGMLSDGTMVSVWTTEPMAGEMMQIDIEFADSMHVNYDIMVTQNGEEVLNDPMAHEHEGMGMHMTAPLISSDPVDIMITFQGYGVDELTGEGIGETVEFMNVVPEFGTIAMMILAVAIISIVAVTAKSRVVPRF